MPEFPVRIRPVWTAFSPSYFRHKLTDTSGHLLLKQERDTSKKYISCSLSWRFPEGAAAIALDPDG